MILNQERKVSYLPNAVTKFNKYSLPEEDYLKSLLEAGLSHITTDYYKDLVWILSVNFEDEHYLPGRLWVLSEKDARLFGTLTRISNCLMKFSNKMIFGDLKTFSDDLKMISDDLKKISDDWMISYNSRKISSDLNKIFGDFSDNLTPDDWRGISDDLMNISDDLMKVYSDSTRLEFVCCYDNIPVWIFPPLIQLPYEKDGLVVLVQLNKSKDEDGKIVWTYDQVNGNVLSETYPQPYHLENAVAFQRDQSELLKKLNIENSEHNTTKESVTILVSYEMHYK